MILLRFSSDVDEEMVIGDGHIAAQACEWDLQYIWNAHRGTGHPDVSSVDHAAQIYGKNCVIFGPSRSQIRKVDLAFAVYFTKGKTYA